jgi:hypothetical protein
MSADAVPGFAVLSQASPLSYRDEKANSQPDRDPVPYSLLHSTVHRLAFLALCPAFSLSPILWLLSVDGRVGPPMEGLVAILSLQARR